MTDSKGEINWELLERIRKPSVCVVCGAKAIATAGHIPVCDKHYQEYCREGEQYLTYRPVYERLLALRDGGEDND